ncbi:uncharacterized protein CANTADRAFT_24638 [Suhomyces tanzawaensis NRRL Y-17324]|uniref:Uncharacterized protein n=1 Tax=Suhomyces tanzawaensis NRRL Y-17324 TaxID=984487 RepID=A0A1E4SQW4_9ASCO|nr:uncharacterized protein CANTADRAFT_24638 [Suhomyces tanzawaensis NRRL Y-17324]ODV81894.1 hypothetical protein CANTADRAFT_24638 [Suhomyces tanzawaensis NRRL Y-17324]
MNLQVLETEIGDVRSDIQSLRLEVAAIEVERAQLALKVLALQDELQQPSPQHRPHEKDADPVPPIIQHSHFDPSISRFFQAPQDEPVPQTTALPRFLPQAEALVEIKENILYENTYRIGGVTAFPLNQRLFAANDEVLGLRFDMFSHAKCQFLQPHYAILKKSTVTDKTGHQLRQWTLYRHTLPVYVPLEDYTKELNSEDGVTTFALHIRNFLVKIQHKHDVVEELTKLDLQTFEKGSMVAGPSGNSCRIIQKVDKDLQCQRLVLYILHKVGEKRKFHQVELNCNLDSIETANISTIDLKHNAVIAMCEGLLRGCKFSDLSTTFSKVIEILLSNKVIDPLT